MRVQVPSPAPSQFGSGTRQCFVGRFPSGQREQTVNLPSVTSMVRIHPCPPTSYAGMAELADALDSGSSVRLGHAGSSPVSRTKALKTMSFQGFFLSFRRQRNSSAGFVLQAVKRIRQFSFWVAEPSRKRGFADPARGAIRAAELRGHRKAVSSIKLLTGKSISFSPSSRYASNGCGGQLCRRA